MKGVKRHVARSEASIDWQQQEPSRSSSDQEPEGPRYEARPHQDQLRQAEVSAGLATPVEQIR